MNLKELQDRLKDINTRMATLEEESRSSNASVQRLAEINDEMDKLIEERDKVETELRKTNQEKFERASKRIDLAAHLSDEDDEEKRAAELIRTLKQNRAITLSTLDTLTIEHQANDIKPTFNEISSIVDAVNFKTVPGGESYSQAFMKGYGEGGYTTEGSNYTESEPTWAYAEINKTKITAYTEVSEEFEKLKPQYYLKEIQRNLIISLRKKLAKEIIKGDGGTGHLTGILAPANKVVALDQTKDLELGAIDEHTLNTILLQFGGDEDIYSGVLVLSKSILQSFLKVRGSDKKPVYRVDFVNRTIDGVPFIISSHIQDHDTADAGDYTFFYGNLKSYDLVSFSPIEIAKSTDYKFRQGQIAYRISGFFGGNVVAWNSILRIKKKATNGGAQ